MEREIQLRALVSILSLLQLFPASATPGRPRPRLSLAAAEGLRNNILTLSVDLHNSRGGAAEKGDCEFLIRYALNLLSCLPGDEMVMVKVVSNFANLLFAAGMAYQYNGPSAIRHLKLAFRRIEPKPSKWHKEFDQYHHLVGFPLSLFFF
ncbi:hypothetical protein EDC01DRAFT_682413 [Geopyxis carbonaria]|nr:hypothetical protein EDC01DRAFT_682413 [Geopyxis carbonaria]